MQIRKTHEILQIKNVKNTISKMIFPRKMDEKIIFAFYTSMSILFIFLYVLIDY